MVIEWKNAVATLFAAALLGACATPPNRAPIEDRVPVARAPLGAGPASAVASAPLDAAKPLPGAENAGKPGYYTVKPGDTLIRIGLENGQNWKDLVKWNNLDNPNVIEVGQVLRVLQPGLDATAVASRPITASRVEARPLDPVAVATVAASAPPPAPAPSPSPSQMPTREGDDDILWSWPATGPVVARFEEGKVKGLSIGGKAGEPVLAAADGRVVYAGSGLRGYGNLIILKHNSTYLTAYAHNQTLLVKEDQNVKRGQKIAEMGSTDSDSVKLHFEIRKQGKPIDPAKLLPPR